MLPQRLARLKSAWAPLVERRVCARQFHPSLSAALHDVPALDYKDHFEEKGVAYLLDPKDFDVAWTRNINHLIDRLNSATKGTQYENQDPKQIILSAARNSNAAHIFNIASMAYNTHFFFQSLSPSPNELQSYPVLQQELIKSFGSINNLFRTMVVTADRMAGPGFVWLVQAQTRHTSASPFSSTCRLVTTYNAGTPFPEARARQQPEDQATAPQSSAGSFGRFSAQSKDRAATPPGTELLTPLLCVSTWEHIYLTKYGVEGKQKYLREWWNSINWGAVDNRIEKSLLQRPGSGAFQTS